MPSSEFYYLDENGKQQDAALHNPILDDVTAARAAMKITREIALKVGIPLHVVDEVFPIK